MGKKIKVKPMNPHKELDEKIAELIEINKARNTVLRKILKELDAKKAKETNQ